MTPAALALLFGAARAAVLPRPVVPVRPEQYASTVVAPHRGRILLVNFWATWCEPCREELPSLVAAWKESGRAFDVVLVSADSRKLKDGVVPAVLSDLAVPFPCYIEDSADPQRFIDTVDPKWEGELPHTVVYGRDGKPAGTAAGRRTKEQFRSMAAAAR